MILRIKITSDIILGDSLESEDVIYKIFEELVSIVSPMYLDESFIVCIDEIGVEESNDISYIYNYMLDIGDAFDFMEFGGKIELQPLNIYYTKFKELLNIAKIKDFIRDIQIYISNVDINKIIETNGKCMSDECDSLIILS